MPTSSSCAHEFHPFCAKSAFRLANSTRFAQNGPLRRGLMPAQRVIPCLGLTHGRGVKRVPFKDLRDAGDPAALAAADDPGGAGEAVFPDIPAASGAPYILLA